MPSDTPRTSLRNSGLKEKLLSAINFTSYYSSYLKDIKPAGGNNQHLAVCPFHNDEHGSFSINLTTGYWNCRGCGLKGDVFSFNSKVNNLSGFKDSLFDLCRKNGLSYDVEQIQKKDAGPAILKPEIADEFHQALLLNAAAMDLLRNLRGITEDTIKHFNIGLRKSEKRITIPIYDAEHRLINIRKYSQIAEQKMINWTGYGKAALYGWPELSTYTLDLPPEEPIIVCEGEWDRLILWQAGFRCLTHTNGALSFQKDWAPAFKDRHIALIYDADDGGRKGAEHTAGFLSKFVASLKIIDLKAAGLVTGTPKDKDISDLARSPDRASTWPTLLREAIAKTEPIDLTKCKETAGVNSDTEGQDNPEIFVKIFEKNGAYFKHAKTGEIPISNFKLEPTKRVKVSGQEVLEANLIMTQSNNGNGTGTDYGKHVEKEPVILWPINWVTKSGFKKTLGDLGSGFIGTEDDLQELKVLLSQKDCSRLIGEEKLGVHQVNGQWVFIASDKTIMSDGTEIPDIIHWNQNTTRQKYEISQVSPATKAEITEVSQALLNFNSPGISASISGWMFAAAIKTRLADAVPQIGKQFPVLLIWGQQGAGKTRTATKIILPFFNDFDEPRKCDELTKFTYMLNAAATNVIPLILDEYKPSKMSQRQQQEVSSFLRAIYNSSTGERGNASDGSLNIRSYTYTAPVVLIGEATNNEPALRDRIVDVMLTLASREGARNIDDFSNYNMAGVGLSYLTWTLGLSNKDIARIYKTHLTTISPLFKDRTRENIATLKTGIELWGQFLTEYEIPYNIDIPLNDIEEYLKTTMLEDAERDFLRPKTAIDQIMEGLSAMAATDKKSLLVEEHDWKLDSTGGRLYIRVQTALPKFRKWARETCFDGEILDENSFRRRLRTEPYYISKSCIDFYHAGSANYAESQAHSVKVYVLSIPKMQDVGIDLSGFGVGDIPF